MSTTMNMSRSNMTNMSGFHSETLLFSAEKLLKPLNLWIPITQRFIKPMPQPISKN